MRYKLNTTKYPELSSLYNSLRQYKVSMDQLASRYVPPSTVSDAGGELFSVRGTYVVPTAPGDAKKIGRVKGRSRTGKTLYVEPKDIGAIREKLRDVEEEIEEVEGEIMRGLFTEVMQARRSLMEGLSYVLQLDLHLALSSIPGVLPEIVEDGVVDAEGYLHPLLKEGEGVRVDLKLRRDGRNRGLTISGSNGGGKVRVGSRKSLQWDHR
jgi:dsDNA-specific endonuclease/ATPase MutS2